MERSKHTKQKPSLSHSQLFSVSLFLFSRPQLEELSVDTARSNTDASRDASWESISWPAFLILSSLCTVPERMHTHSLCMLLCVCCIWSFLYWCACVCACVCGWFSNAEREMRDYSNFNALIRDTNALSLTPSCSALSFTHPPRLFFPFLSFFTLISSS